jgi:hypothetical protein
MTDQEINRLVEPILRKWLSPYGFRRSVTRSGEDHAGDPSLFVAAHFEAGHIPDPTDFLDAIGEIRRTLEARGDKRYPYVEPKVPDRRPEAAE